MEPSAYMPKSYDPVWVMASIAVSVLAGYVVLDLADRVHAARRRPAAVWLGLGALVMGSGIWSMHFLAMLSLSLPVPMRYTVGTTVLSWLLAVLGSAGVLGITRHAVLTPRLWAAGTCLMAASIVGMHFTGMWAMTISPALVYDPYWVALSVVIALAGSAGALWLAFVMRGRREPGCCRKKIGAALLMGAAISGMHYTSMVAVSFPWIEPPAGAPIDRRWLAMLTGALPCLLLVMALLAAAVERLIERRTSALLASLRRARAQLRQQGHYDELTALATRWLLDKRLDEAIAAGRAFSVVYINLDAFRLLNKHLGYRVGDVVLASVADRLCRVTDARDTVARVAGDEFVILAASAPGATQAGTLADRLLAAVRCATPQAPGLTASIGWTCHPGHGRRADALIAAADRAMSQVKRQGKNGHTGYRPEMAEQASVAFALQHDLDKALAENQFVVHFQPQYRLADGRLSGAEALVRWAHPVHGRISPERFVPMAERSGKIETLEIHIFEAVCARIRDWRDRGLPVPRISVNLSAARLGNSRLPERVAAGLMRYGVSAGDVMFEITESVAIQSVADAADTLRRLARMGVEVALDDFGTGHASLSYLEKLPVQQLKIDRSFVQVLTQRQHSLHVVIVRSIVALARQLDLSVVAEGVETEHQLRRVRALGCDEAQGFLFSRPVPADAFERLMIDRRPAFTSAEAETPEAPGSTPEFG